MPVLLKIPVVWSGATGLPGVSTFYSANPDVSAVADIKTFFTSLATLIPTGITLEVPSSGDSIDSGNGQLIGEWSGGQGGTVTGSASQVYAAGVGVAAEWRTGGIRNGRRVRGRTFLAPLSSGILQANGTIDTAMLTAIRNTATILAASGALTVWSRPSAPGASDGSAHDVLSAFVPDRVTSLRSRRY